MIWAVFFGAGAFLAPCPSPSPSGQKQKLLSKLPRRKAKLHMYHTWPVSGAVFPRPGGSYHRIGIWNWWARLSTSSLLLFVSKRHLIFELESEIDEQDCPNHLWFCSSQNVILSSDWNLARLGPSWGPLGPSQSNLGDILGSTDKEREREQLRIRISIEMKVLRGR